MGKGEADTISGPALQTIAPDSFVGAQLLNKYSYLLCEPQSIGHVAKPLGASTLKGRDLMQDGIDFVGVERAAAGPPVHVQWFTPAWLAAERTWNASAATSY